MLTRLLDRDLARSAEAELSGDLDTALELTATSWSWMRRTSTSIESRRG